MSGFVKLYGSILDSSIWGEPAGTRLVWITMLAMADEHGQIVASSGGLARRANVTREELDDAIRVLSSPDPDSKSPEFEGRRIEKIDGGWAILNHRKYRDMRTPKQVADAERQAAWRANNPDRQSVTRHNGHKLSREVSASASEISDLKSGDPDPERARAEVDQAAAGETELQRDSRLWVENPMRASYDAREPWTWRPVLEVLAHFELKFGGTPVRPTKWADPRLRAVVERFSEGSTPDDLRMAIDGAALDDHIQTHPEFQNVVTVLRDANQVDRFMRLARSGPRPPPEPKAVPVRNAGTALIERAQRIAAESKAGGRA